VPFSAGTTVNVIGQREVELKLLAAAPRILEENRLMVAQMLETVRGEIQSVPGYRSSLRVEVAAIGVTTLGKLLVAARGYWREFGTRGRNKSRSNRRRAYTAALGGFGSGGEKAGLYATHALSGVRRLIKLYYGNAQWWRL
jgi:hypothetical protein